MMCASKLSSSDWPGLVLALISEKMATACPASGEVWGRSRELSVVSCKGSMLRLPSPSSLVSVSGGKALREVDTKMVPSDHMCASGGSDMWW